MHAHVCVRLQFIENSNWLNNNWGLLKKIGKDQAVFWNSLFLNQLTFRLELNLFILRRVKEKMNEWSFDIVFFFLLVIHLRLCQQIDDTVVG